MQGFRKLNFALGQTDGRLRWGLHVKQLIEYVVRALVSSPQEVEIVILEEAEGFVCKLKVAEEDIGKVIGKEGRTIHALRTLASLRLKSAESKLQLEVEAKPPAPPPASPLLPLPHSALSP